MGDMSLDKQRLFVRFVTSSNRTSQGGLAGGTSVVEAESTGVYKFAASGANEDTDSSKRMDEMLPSLPGCTNW
ncbi:TPA: hypothetical protein N0F65_003687 [Lagenidium giganteum]|uniref:HECT domain-containing protein n=1 Tax=Lagenidium giganteum TaxID=4803 RepID=A0AAV2YU57_9STRA|nr:TPA: hypothetical protein N0F65_003687 [Lagenidium giganteum]